MGALEDPRKESAPNFTYPMEALLFQAVCMFACRLEARRQIGWLLRTSAAAQTVQAVFGVGKVAHGDTVNNVVCAVDPGQVQEVVCATAETLIRKKVFAGRRLLGTYYCIAIDGTETFSFNERHCEHCLTRTQKGKTSYYHNVLEAKLVTPDGFAISLMSEFIANPGPNPTKQDCERKAFYRLASRLKERFPKLPIVLLMDALYACGPVFDICRRNRWKYIINLKDGSLPSVNEEFHALCERNPGNQLRRTTGTKNREVRQHLRWANDIAYVDNDKREHRLDVFECRETKPGKGGEDQCTTFRWVSNFTVKESNVEPLANQGGRLRWKVENEGFNTQKNGGYELEHTYTSNEQGMKNYYLLLQVACTIIQLIEKGSLLKKAVPKGLGAAKNLARILLEAWRTQPLSPENYRTLCDTSIQIRFDTS